MEKEDAEPRRIEEQGSDRTNSGGSKERMVAGGKSKKRAAGEWRPRLDR